MIKYFTLINHYRLPFFGCRIVVLSLTLSSSYWCPHIQTATWWFNLISLFNFHIVQFSFRWNISILIILLLHSFTYWSLSFTFMTSLLINNWVINSSSMKSPKFELNDDWHVKYFEWCIIYFICTVLHRWIDSESTAPTVNVVKSHRPYTYTFSLFSPWSRIINEICCIKIWEVLLKMEGQFPDSWTPLAEDNWSTSSTYHTLQGYGHVAFIQSTHGALIVQVDLSQ